MFMHTIFKNIIYIIVYMYIKVQIRTFICCYVEILFCVGISREISTEASGRVAK